MKFVRKLRCPVYRLRLYIRARRVNFNLLIAAVLFIARRNFDLRARTRARDATRVKRCPRYRALLVSSLGKIRFSTFVERLGRRDRKLFRQSRVLSRRNFVLFRCRCFPSCRRGVNFHRCGGRGAGRTRAERRKQRNRRCGETKRGKARRNETTSVELRLIRGRAGPAEF